MSPKLLVDAEAAKEVLRFVNDNGDWSRREMFRPDGYTDVDEWLRALTPKSEGGKAVESAAGFVPLDMWADAQARILILERFYKDPRAIEAVAEWMAGRPVKEWTRENAAIALRAAARAVGIEVDA